MLFLRIEFNWINPKSCGGGYKKLGLHFNIDYYLCHPLRALC
jgi:hypothetical protein